MAVLSEQEVTKLVGLHPKDLKLSAATITNEEGSTMTGYCLSLKEMPLPDVFACRKLRLSRSVKVGRHCSVLYLLKECKSRASISKCLLLFLYIPSP